MSETLLQTKLYIPPVPNNVVLRPRLIQKLDDGARGKLILISAPAGFGKTSLITSWLAETSVPNLSRDRCAWVSLDKGDNDTPRFLAYCLSALRNVSKSIGETWLPALLSAEPPAWDTVLTGLLNEVTQLSTPAVLVLDDFHVISDQAVHDALVFLLDNSPPSLRVIISSRADPPWPLARLRAGGRMTELRANDLRFSAEETASFLNDAMGLALTSKQVLMLDQRVEGWIAGLQLAALSMSGHRDVSSFITAFTGSHRYVLDYLVEEVLDRQEPAVQEFLLRTSVLDRLTAPLCNVVAEGENSQAILSHLDRTNLFLIPLDDERRWYRYHHLFGDLLLSRLKQVRPELIPALRRRASEWFEQNYLLAEAVSQAQAAGDVDYMVRLIERNGLVMAFHGELRPFLSWLDALPPEMVKSRPWLSLAYSWVLAFAGRLTEVEPYLEQATVSAAELPIQDTDDVGQAEAHLIQAHILAARAFLLLSQEDLDPGVEYARQALDELPRKSGDDLMLRGFVTLILGISLRLQGCMEESANTLSEAMSLSRSLGDNHLSVTILWETAILEFAQGKLRQAYATCQEALQMGQAYPRHSGRSLRATSYTLERVASIKLEWNKIEEATQAIDESLRLAQQWGHADAFYEACLTQNKILRAAGALDEAWEAIEKARAVSGVMSPWYAMTANVQQTLTQVAQGEVSAVEDWLDSGELSAEDDVPPIYCSLYSEFARVLLATGRIPEALRLLAKLCQVAEEVGMLGVLVGSLSAQAVALDAIGEREQALLALKRALNLAEQEGHVRAFLEVGQGLRPLLHEASNQGIQADYAGKLLKEMGREPGINVEPAAAGSPPEHEIPQDLADPLTDRELEVLRLLSTSLSSTEIGDQLFIAPSTVRSHIKSIYGKLNVHKRLEAVQRAHNMGLL